jgi:hypothetical protein
MTTIVFRAALYGCALLAGALVLLLFVHRDNRLAIKTLWIAAVFLLLAINQTRLPFILCEGQACQFYRNAFGVVSFVLVSVSVFVVFWIQLPEERVPRFRGKVLAVTREHGREIPRVEFQDDQGRSKVFEDRLAETILPNHAFAVEERVIVRAPWNAAPHIDRAWIIRWYATLLLLLITVFASCLALVCHLRLHAARFRV